MQDDKIVIELGDPNPPVQVQCRGLPAAGNYVLEPRHKPELARHISKISWRAVSKELHITVQETSDLDVFHWMEYIQNRHKEISKGPFIDLEKDALILRMFDGENKELGRVRFKNLSLGEHMCSFGSDKTGGLKHKLVIKYQEVDRIEQLDPDKKDAQKVVDEEWQTVNGP